MYRIASLLSVLTRGPFVFFPFIFSPLSLSIFRCLCPFTHFTFTPTPPFLSPPFFFLISFSFLFGSLFSVLINVLWPIMAVTQRAAPVICSVSAVRLAEAPRLVNWPALSFHRDQKPLIEFMQPLLFLNSHFVSDEYHYGM